MATPLNAQLEEAMNEALFITRELGFPASDVGDGQPQKIWVEARHLQLARRYQELGDLIHNILLKKAR